MSAFTDEQIAYWANQRERQICAEHDLVCDRISLAITAGFSEYEIPNYITNIRTVLWKGKEVYPKSEQGMLRMNNAPTESSSNIPYEYLMAGKGMRVLKFYPCPSESISAYAGSDLFTAAADMVAVIIEFYRTPSQDDSTKRIPDWLRRYLLKSYVCAQAFIAEGPTQDGRASQYYQEKSIAEDEEFLSKVKQLSYMAVVETMGSDNFDAMRRPGRPILPPEFTRRAW